jgi:hypothetical protein
LRSLNSSPISTDVRESRSGGPTEADKFPALEICRGRTQHPIRPIQTHRFLIGSSSRCDLQLGGAEMPALQSVIVTDGPDVWLEALAPAPAIEVNGRPTTSIRLAHGDRIRIGAFEFVARVPEVPAPSTAPADGNADLEVPADEPAPTELSAAELVERIEAATQLVNEFEERQRLGLEALLGNAEQRKPQPATSAGEAPAESLIPIPELPDDSDGMLGELEALVTQLSGVVGELEKQSGAQWRREVGYFDAVSSLFETQDRLSRQLEMLLRRVASLNADRTERQPDRAIA